MTINEISASVTAISSGQLPGFTAQHWRAAFDEMRAVSERSLSFPCESLMLMVLCRVIEDKDGYSAESGGEKELIAERIKSVFAPVYDELSNAGLTLIPLNYKSVSLHMQAAGSDPDVVAAQLFKLFSAISQEACDSLAMALYAVVYEYYKDNGGAWIQSCLNRLIDIPFESCRLAKEKRAQESQSYTVPPANAYSSVGPNSYTPARRLPGTWLPLKIYLIVTTGFIIFILLLVYLATSVQESGAGSAAMSIMDVNGNMVSVEPGMEEATLFLFGTVGYEAIISGITTLGLIIIAWRVVLITFIYIFRAMRRKRAMRSNP